jgi:hypothetical protein
MSSDPVDAIISGKASSVQQIGKLAPSLVFWLKESLPIAYQDKALKQKIKSLFGVVRFTTNLAHFELWDDLIRDCGGMALALGRDMQKYFLANDLGTVLGEAIPNVFAKVHFSESTTGNLFVTTPCSKDDGVRRQVGTVWPGMILCFCSIVQVQVVVTMFLLVTVYFKDGIMPLLNSKSDDTVDTKCRMATGIPSSSVRQVPVDGSSLDTFNASDTTTIRPASAEDCSSKNSPPVSGWTRNPKFSQLWNEQSFIHYLRMVAMGINHRFQEAVKKVPKLLLLSSVNH